MDKTTKTALMVIGLLAVGVVAYMFFSKAESKTAKEEKENRDIVIKRN